MDFNRDTYIFKNLKQKYDFIKDKYEVVGLFLQGSQNYEMDIYDDDYKSDIDTKAIILPSFEDIIYNKTATSITLEMENKEHIDVKDIRIMFDTFLKQNVNFIEILFTKFKIINPKYKDLVQELIDNKEEIARYDINKALNTQVGMSNQKFIALKHPYPSIKDKIEKYGFDGKQLHHILRMNDFIKKYVNGKSYEECLIPNDKEYLIKIKKGYLSLQEAEELASKFNNETYEIGKKYISESNVQNEKVSELLNNVKFKMIERYFKELLKEKPKEIPKFNNVFVTSDNHFFHNNIIEYEKRPFENIKDMNEKMINSWNNVVKENDMVYIIGDFSFGNAIQTNDILKKLNGFKTLIIGNHDKFIDEKKFDKSLFYEICYYKKTNINGVQFVMCHYPFASKDNSEFQLYGHIHKNDGLHIAESVAENSYNVGVDLNNYVPIPIENIFKQIKKE
jgi:calcineurin-like phosphoesterase family protein